VIKQIIDSDGDGKGNISDGAYSVAADGSGGAFVAGFDSDNVFAVKGTVKSRHEILKRI